MPVSEAIAVAAAMADADEKIARVTKELELLLA